MFERVLFQVLTESLQRLAERPKALKAFLDSLPLDQALIEPEAVQELVLSFARQKRPIIMSYAREDAEFPVWAIVLAGETEDLRTLGDEGGMDDLDGEPENVSIWTQAYQVLCYAKHPDVALYLYELLMGIMISRRIELLQRANLDNLSALSGMELSPDRIWLPEFLFVRAFSVSAFSERLGIPFLEPTQPLKAKRITGVTVSSDGQPRFRRQRTLVRAYDPDED